MTYTDLIKAVSTDANCSQTLVKQIIETLSNHVAREVRAGVPLRIPALGTFSSSKREERLGRNPATGGPVVIPAKMMVKFRAGKILQDKVEQ